MDVKKTLAFTIIAVSTLVVLVVGATYAYFSVTGTNNYGTKTITASAPSVGSVALASGSNLTMALTRAQMMKKSADTTYYASASGATTTATTATIATATVTGAGTFTCNYTINVAVSATNSMYTAFQNMTGKTAGQIVLTITPATGTATGTAQTYDFNSANLFPSNALTISGAFTGITSSTTAANRQITAQLKFVNKKDVVQDALEGTDITFTFTATAFTCTATA